MEQTEDENIQKYVKKCLQCLRNTLLLYKCEFTSISCGYNLIKRKNELSKVQRKRINFIIRLKCAKKNFVFV